MALEMLKRLSPISNNNSVREVSNKPQDFESGQGCHSPKGFSLSQQYEEEALSSATTGSPTSVDSVGRDQLPHHSSDQSSTTPLFCTPECIYDRSDRNKSKKMLRCCLCMHWYHFKCVQEDPKTTGVWTCFTCRQMPELVNNLYKEMKSIHSESKESNTYISDILMDMKKQMAILISEQKILQDTNTTLIKKLETVTAEKAELQNRLNISENRNKEVHTAKNYNKNINTTKSLLIGNSLLRNVSSIDTKKLVVSSHSGATFESLTTELSKSTETYDKIIVVTGTTDCQNPETTTTEIQNKSHNMLLEAKKHSKSVIISSVLPRTDPEKTGCQIKINCVNESLEKLCLENPNCQFVNNDGVFKLCDSSPNDSLFVKDGYHVNTKGAKQLLDNLQLSHLTMVKQPPRKYNQMYSYGSTTDPNQIRDSRSLSYQAGYQTGYRCSWCRQLDHQSDQCPSRRNRCCFRCQAPDHVISNCPWRNCPWSG